MKLASEGKRFGAYCIDAIVPVVAAIMYGIVIAVLIASYSMISPFGFGYGYGYGYGYGFGHNSALSSGGIAATLIIATLLVIAYIAIQMVFYSRSKTIGKAVLGLQVVSSKDGKPVGFWKMLFREWFVKSASGSVFGLGFIWIIIDEKNRGWHDKILDTYVIDIKESDSVQRMSSYAPARPEPKSEPIIPARPEPKSEPIIPARPEPEPEPVVTVSPEPESEPVVTAAESEPVVTADEPENSAAGSVIDIAEVVTVNAQSAAEQVKDAVPEDVNVVSEGENDE